MPAISNRNKNRNSSRKPVEERIDAPAPEVTRAGNAAQKTEEQYKLKALSGIHPTVKDWLKDKLGLDLESNSISARDVYDITQGKLTRPLAFVVTPLAYDKAKQEQVEMPKIRNMASIRLVMPMENGKPVALDDKHRVFIETVPCRPYLVKGDTEAFALSEPEVAPADKKDVQFSDEQLQALEGIGINPNRMFGGRNHLSREEKEMIFSGEKFPVDGVVRTTAGCYVNVCGEAVLATAKDGSVTCKFQPNYPEEREAGLVLDILSGRTIGALDLDVFKRDSTNRIIRDENNKPILNEAGMNLINYGMAMQPVLGYTHQREFDKKENRWRDSTESAYYEVTVQNGNLYASKMREVKEKNEEGKEVSRWESGRVRVRDGKVYLDGNAKDALEFASEKDMKSYLEGRGGVVKGVTHRDYKTRKDTVYDAFVVADNRKAGFGHAFSPETSKKIIEAREAKQRTRRRQNFGIGF